ncbi:LysR family transcriptional regulator [Gordonia rhizosphera]|uniref:Putative LysR family transcriptional regulator n=1 Tax=Gordonia rhizosphera NBRC 16068 TaxID=1108045 RepID=K6VS91_9ACTN|nr:LysR family transcriptional regulator [Gordonia rhizosphera]GAB89770.1 putative LysR family transcriptional regulator [Gordonia rhizosphera NBRC 16068]
MLNVTRLRILRELHLRGTLAQVAQALSYTPSAISQQLSILERETGVQLLEHVGRRVRLTDDALTLVTHTEIVLAQLEQAEAELAAAQPTVRGTLRLASFQTAVLEIFPAVLTLMEQKHPALQVEITMREVNAAYGGLLSSQFDVILGEEYPGLPDPVRDGTERTDLVTDPLYLATPAHGPLGGAPRNIAELASTHWALDPPGSAAGDWARTVCRNAGFEPQVRFEGPDPLLHAHLVRTGHAAAFVPALIAGDHLDGTQLAGLPGDPHRILYTAVRAGRAGHPAVRALREALAHTVAERQPQRPTRTARM